MAIGPAAANLANAHKGNFGGVKGEGDKRIVVRVKKGGPAFDQGRRIELFARRLRWPHHTQINQLLALVIQRNRPGYFAEKVTNALLRRIRDFAQIKGNGIIDRDISQFALNALNVDKHGLDEMDNRILTTIIDKFKGGPVGLTTIATAVGEEGGTIEEVYEPFLIMEGYLARTPRGRQVTEKAYKHLGRISPKDEGTLFG